MINIDKDLIKKFPTCAQPLRMPSRLYLQEGAHFILQLHDELYYEVVSEDLQIVAQIIKDNMENALKNGSVPFPVTVKIGPSWGELAEMIVD